VPDKLIIYWRSRDQGRSRCKVKYLSVLYCSGRGHPYWCFSVEVSRSYIRMDLKLRVWVCFRTFMQNCLILHWFWVFSGFGFILRECDFVVYTLTVLNVTSFSPISGGSGIWPFLANLTRSDSIQIFGRFGNDWHIEPNCSAHGLFTTESNETGLDL